MNATTRKLLASLPPGLSIYRQRKGKAPGRDAGGVPVGKAPWEVWPEDYQWSFYARVRKAGVAGVVVSLERGELDEETVRRGLAVYERQVGQKWDAVKAVAFDVAVGRARLATIGEVVEAYLSVYPGRRRNAMDLRAVCGWVMGWRKEFDRWDEGSDEVRRVDALDAGEVLNARSVLRYFRARGGNYERPERGNLSRNRTLLNARECFRSGPRSVCYEGLLLPESLAEWMRVPLLKVPEIDREGELLTDGQCAELVARGAALEGSADAGERELAVVAKAYRRLGLRPIELEAARREWLEEKDGEWYLVLMTSSRGGAAFAVKNGRVGRLRIGRVEDADSLAAAWVPRGPGPLVLPAGSAEERRAMVRDRHNKLVKGIAGETPSRQGNYRLRKYVSNKLRARLGLEAAALHLRDSEAVARKHYTVPDSSGLPLVTDAMLL